MHQDITLIVDGFTWVRFVTPKRRRWTWNNYITRMKSGSQLGIRCGRENQHPAEGAPIEQLKFRSVGEKMLECGTCPRKAGPPRLPVEQPRRTEKKRCYDHKSGGQYIAVLFSLQLTSHIVKPFVTLSNHCK